MVDALLEYVHLLSRHVFYEDSPGWARVCHLLNKVIVRGKEYVTRHEMPKSIASFFLGGGAFLFHLPCSFPQTSSFSY